MSQNILRIDASARQQGSVTRQLTGRITARIGNDATVVHRDLARDIPPLLSEAWVNANFTAPEDRSDEQQAELAASDGLVAELQAADVLVLGVPIYNFGIPANLKAWIDQIARARLTFQYTETGAVGLLTGKRAIIAMASGGTAVGSEIDFASGYLRHVLGFVGINDVTFIAADQLGQAGDEAVVAAQSRIDALTLTEQAA